MALSDFHTLVRGIINRGNEFDTEIVAMTRAAARWVERNNSMKYMEVIDFFSVLEDDVEVAYNPGGRVKSIAYFRLNIEGETSGDLQFHYLKEGNPQDFNVRLSARPDYYYLEEGRNRLILSARPDEDYDAEFFFRRYTDWPTDTTKQPWLIEHAEDVILGQTMIYLSPIVRNPRLTAEYRPIRDEGLNTLLGAEAELKSANSSHAMKMYVSAQS
jgi:hypothetical protein